MVVKRNMVQRPLNHALADEVDSILIDEASYNHWSFLRSKCRWNELPPLPYGGPSCEVFGCDDYIIDIQSKTIGLSDSGIGSWRILLENPMISKMLYSLIDNALSCQLHLDSWHDSCGELARNLDCRLTLQVVQWKSSFDGCTKRLKLKKVPHQDETKRLSIDYLPKPFPYVCTGRYDWYW